MARAGEEPSRAPREWTEPGPVGGDKATQSRAVHPLQTWAGHPLCTGAGAAATSAAAIAVISNSRNRPSVSVTAPSSLVKESVGEVV